MPFHVDVGEVLRQFPREVHDASPEFLGSAGGYSGAQFWRLTTRIGVFCLRQWPAEHPNPERLDFIHSVLQHASQHGFPALPTPLRATDGGTYVRWKGRLWELALWLPGEADVGDAPTAGRLNAAMTALAAFHRAVADFPLPPPGRGVSPGIQERHERLRRLLGVGLKELASVVTPSRWPELASRATRYFGLFPKAAPRVLAVLDGVADLSVAITPCIRDIGRDHVLFEGERVVGLIDFGAMRPDNVATDIARLLGGLAADDGEAWRRGIAAYETTRALSDKEASLIRVFDQSAVLLGPLSWFEWVFRDHRDFESRDAILARVDEMLLRLAHLASSSPRM